MRTRRPNALSYKANERLVGSRGEHGERGMRHVEAREWPNPAAVGGDVGGCLSLLGSRGVVKQRRDPIPNPKLCRYHIICFIQH